MSSFNNEFDPEKVRHYAPFEYDEMPGEMVKAEDYSKLLSLYHLLKLDRDSWKQSVKDAIQAA